MLKKKRKVRIIAFFCAVSLIFAGVPYTSADAKVKVKLNKKKIEITKGSSKTVKFLGAKAKVKWSVSDKKKAVLATSGKYKAKCKIKAKKTGKVNVTAKYKGKKYKCVVTIVKAKNKKKATPTPVASTKKPAAPMQTQVTLAQVMKANETESLLKTYGSISYNNNGKSPSAEGGGVYCYIDSDVFYYEGSTHKEIRYDDCSYYYNYDDKSYSARIYPMGSELKTMKKSGFGWSEEGTKKDKLVSCTRKGSELILVTRQDEKTLASNMAAVSEETKASYGYKEGDWEESIFVVEADTLVLKSLTSTIYHKDGLSDYQMRNVFTHGEKRPVDIKKITAHMKEGDDTAPLTLVMEPGTKNEKKQVVSLAKDAYYYVNDSEDYCMWFKDTEMKKVSPAKGYVEKDGVTLYSKKELTVQDITMEAMKYANNMDRLIRYYNNIWMAEEGGYEKFVTSDNRAYFHMDAETEYILSLGEHGYERNGDIYAGTVSIGEAEEREKSEALNIVVEGTLEDETLVSKTVGDDGNYQIVTEWRGDSYKELGSRYKGYVDGGYARCIYTVEPYFWVALNKTIEFYDAVGTKKNTVELRMESDIDTPQKAAEMARRLEKANVCVTVVVEPETEKEKTYYVYMDATNDINIKCGKNECAVLFVDKACTKRYFSGNANLAEDRTIYVKLAKKSDVTIHDMVEANKMDSLMGEYESVYAARGDGKFTRYQSGTGDDFIVHEIAKGANDDSFNTLFYKNCLYVNDGDNDYSFVYLSPKTEEETKSKYESILGEETENIELLEASVDNGDGTVTIYTRVKSTELYEKTYTLDYPQKYKKGDIGLFSYTLDARTNAVLKMEEQVSHRDGSVETEDIMRWEMQYNTAKPSKMEELEEYYDIANGFASDQIRRVDYVLNPGQENEEVYTGYARKGKGVRCSLRKVLADGSIIEYAQYTDEACTKEVLTESGNYTDNARIYLKEKRRDGNLTYASSVTNEMCTPQYWIERMENPDEELMSYKEIMKLNQDMLAASDTNMNDLEHMAATYDANKLGKNLSNLEIRNDKEYYINGVHLTDRDGYFSSMSANVASGAALDMNGSDGSAAQISYAVCAKRGELRVWPTSDYVGYSASDRDDEIVNAAIDVNEPFVAKYVTADGKFIWGYSNNCTGWVEADKLAICADKEEWLDAWKIENTNILVVTGDKVTLEKSVLDPEVSEMELMIGTRLKLVPEKDIPALVGERGTWNNYVVYVPVRKEDGSYKKRMALVSQKANVNVGFLPLTQANVVKTALSCLGNRYGWGGMIGAMDCSLYNRSVYRCFGLELPRNTTWQQKIPGKVTTFSAVSDKTAADAEANKEALDSRKQLLDKAPAGSMLYFSGHTMMYLGKVDGKYYVVSALGSLYDVGDTSVRTVYSVAINTLDVRRGNGSTWLANLCGIVSF